MLSKIQTLSFKISDSLETVPKCDVNIDNFHIAL